MRVYVVMKREVEDDALVDVRVVAILRTSAAAADVARVTGADEILEFEVGGELIRTVMA